ncbi:MAG TPA: NAD(P)H-hydrate dehydratase [Polyangiaceae bacterium]|nr:NAD(P)H-hydrate dehydratase [Polyangiaceae bacterium]
MTPVLSRAQMRAFDAHAVERCRVPSLLLMENAGRGATDVLVRELLGGRCADARVVVVCGTGNNGGDGLVIARHLLVRGARPIVLLAGDERRASADARANLDAWRGLGGELRPLAPEGAEACVAAAGADARVVVDALFGTGLDRPIEGWLAELVGAVNAAPAPRFAVDLPSGLDADNGRALGVAVQAHVTVTFAHHKLGLLTPNGARLAGRVHVVDIGVPASLVADVGESARRLEESDLARWATPRQPGAHKNSAGHVLVLAGSPGKIGAPQLVARGAMRAGAGLVTIGTWPEAAARIESRVLEVMTARIDPTRLDESLDAALVGKHAVAVGPGFGVGEDARAAVEHVLAAWQGPLVVDADALTLLAGRPAALAAAPRAILTPHPGELARLLGTTPAEIESDRFAAAREAARSTRSVAVLKGAHTIVASPDARVAVSPVACPALATAGSGDVLGGIVAAMACTLPPFEAACAGVLVHALAGEAWSREHAGADRGMLASEIADRLPGLVARVRA